VTSKPYFLCVSSLRVVKLTKLGSVRLPGRPTFFHASGFFFGLPRFGLYNKDMRCIYVFFIHNFCFCIAPNSSQAR
jgi:hypothetical protein